MPKYQPMWNGQTLEVIEGATTTAAKRSTLAPHYKLQPVPRRCDATLASPHCSAAHLLRSVSELCPVLLQSPRSAALLPRLFLQISSNAYPRINAHV